MNAVHHAAAAAVLLAAGCGNQAASATFDGAVHGLSLQPRDAISAPATVAFTTGSAPVAAIVISDAAGLCTKVSGNFEPKSSLALLIFLADVNPSTGAIEAASGTGTFPVFVVGSGPAPRHFAVASFGANDAVCRQIAADSADALSGSVTLTGNGGGAYAGAYDLTFDSGDRVTGKFQTATCQGLTTYLGRLTHDCG